LLAFRLLYLVLPLIFALAVVLVFERDRLRSLLPSRGGHPGVVRDLD
jgi:hypothetical protein